MNRPSEQIYVDKGLKTYFLNIYQYVALNLALAGATAFYVSSNPYLFAMIMNTPLFFVVAFGPLAIAYYMGSRINEISVAKAQMLYWVYGATIGASLSTIFIVFSATSIFQCFIMASVVFGAAAIYGRFTSRDLSSMRSTLMIGLFGIIGVTLINIFMQSSMIQYLLSWAIVGVFSAFVAYDMQQLLAIYFTRQSDEMIEKVAIIGALNLFIAFVNIFIALLHLFGGRRND